MRRFACFALVSSFSFTALAQEVAPLPDAPAGSHADGFASPNGQLGAGLSISGEGTGRAWGEMSFFTESESQTVFDTTIDTNITLLSFLLGGGYKFTRELEGEVMLGLGFASYSVSVEADGVSEEDGDSDFGVANLHLGVNWVKAQAPLKFKVGGAIEYGPWHSDYDLVPFLAATGGASLRGEQDVGLWLPETLTLLAPGRIEYGDQPVFTGDGALGFHLPTDGGDVDLSLLLAPGIGYYASDMFLLGFRLPMVFVPTSSGDMAQLGAEPYVRLDFGGGFVNARFTLNLDEPLGFSFDDDGIWGLHVGGGGTF